MTRALLSVVGILFMIIGTFGQYGNSDRDESRDRIQQMTDSQMTNFDWTVFKKLSDVDNQNVLISPLSLKFAMAILYQAAGGTTENQIKWVLNFENKTENEERYQKLLEKFQLLNKEYQLNIASRMYLDRVIRIEQKYRQQLKTSFKTDIVEFDVTTPEVTVIDANKWVENFTQGNIKNLVAKEDIENAIVLLLNTIYFKGSWINPFPSNETVMEKFFTNSTSYVKIPMMKQTQRFEYTESKKLDSQIIRLPYKGGNLSMYILLPKTSNGISTLITEITPSKIARETALLEMSDVKLSIPKFSYEVGTHLVPVFKEMGIRDLFDNEASIPGLSRGRGVHRRLYVSNILQKSGIEFSETGTVAYSATEVTLVNKFGDDEEVEFNANRPFVFYIEDENSKQILFMGKVENPSKVTPINLSDDNGSKSGNV